MASFLSREYGYAFPTDLKLAETIGSDARTAKRGLAALENAGLIERAISIKRGAGGNVEGKIRKIYLCIPSEGNSIQSKKGEYVSQKRQKQPKGHVSPKGQKRVTEGTYVCPYKPDSITPDTKVGHRTSTDNGSTCAREDFPNPFLTPASWGTDRDFLAAFDNALNEISFNKDMRATDTEVTAQRAFDAATDSRDEFMPVHWRDLRSTPTFQIHSWFEHRALSILEAV